MKKIILFSAVIFSLFGVSLKASAVENPLLSFSAYSRLSPSQKNEYILLVQKLVVDVSKAAHRDVNPHQQAEWQELNLFLQQFLNEARAEYEGIDAACRVTAESVRKLSSDDLLGKISQTWSCTETPPNVKANDAPFRPLVVERVNLISEEIARRQQSGEFAKVGSSVRRSLREAPETLQNILADLRRRGTGAGPVAEEQVKSVSEAIKTLQKPAQKSKSTLQAEPKETAVSASAAPAEPPRAPVERSPKKPKPSADRTSDNAKADRAVAQPQVKAVSSAIASPAQDAGNTCDAYGFFTAKPENGVCQGLKKLPSQFQGSLLNPEQIVCLKEGGYICNPLIFGFLSENQNGGRLAALCVESSALYSVESCARESEKQKTSAAVRKLWEGPRGEELYNDLGRAIVGYCGSPSLQNKKVERHTRKMAGDDCTVILRKFDENIKNGFLHFSAKPVLLKASGAQ